MSADHIATVREALTRAGIEESHLPWVDQLANALAALDALAADLERAWAAVRDEAEQTCIEIDLRKAAEARVEQLEAALREVEQTLWYQPPHVAVARKAIDAALAPNSGGEE